MMITLGELITELVDLDIADPALHDHDVTIEQDADDLLWIVVQ